MNQREHEQYQAALEKWEESEAVLRYLRIEGEPLPEPDREALILWSQSLPTI